MPDPVKQTTPEQCPHCGAPMEEDFPESIQPQPWRDLLHDMENLEGLPE